MNNIFYCIIAALCFAIWPILVKKTGSPNNQISAILVMIFTAIPTIIFLVSKGQNLSLPWKYTLLAIGIGLINGFGMFFYIKGISTPQPGLYVGITATLMPIFGLVLGFLITGQPEINMTKILGIMIVIIGMYYIMK